MKQRDLFLLSDAALRDVIDRIRPEQLELPVPAEWSRTPDPTLLDIVAAHAYDEAWVPDVLAGRTIEEVGDKYGGDLLGGDELESYDRLNDAATVAANRPLSADDMVHLSYGDFPVSVYFEHIATYRAFQAWGIARLIGIDDYSLPPELVELLWEIVAPQADAWREMGIFPPEVAVPDDADRETKLLGRVGYLMA
jgi:hypothetical protein